MMSRLVIYNGAFDDDPAAEAYRSALGKINTQARELYGGTVPVGRTLNVTSVNHITNMTIVNAVTDDLYTLLSGTGREVIGGTEGPDSETVRSAMTKVNAMTAYLYTLFVPEPSDYGPQASQTRPDGAIDINPGDNIQSIVDANAGSAVFWLTAGTHSRTSAITPKSGNTFVGEFGAILDGGGWSTSDTTQGCFRAHNQNIDTVTIRNLVIQNFPQRGIHAYKDFSHDWTVEYCEITGNKYGVLMPHGHVVRHNYIHHNVGTIAAPAPEDRGGGYAAYQAIEGVWEYNEIAFNGTEQKIAGATDVIMRANYVHDNLGDGIWYDGDNTGSLIEDNTCEDNAGSAIFYEVSGSAVIRNNTVRRSGEAGLFISTSKNVEAYGNVLEDNFRGITWFVNFSAVGGGIIGYDLSNVNCHNNTVTIGPTFVSGALASLLTHTGTGTMTPYMNGTKGLAFTANDYNVPTTGNYWYWEALKSWAQWQLLGLDTSGTLTVS